MSVIKMTDLDLTGKRVLIRSDLNVPIKDGKVNSDVRILASLPTIKAALKQNARVMVTSHLGRPTEGVYNKEFSLQPIVNYLKEKALINTRLVKKYLDGVYVSKGELVVLENVRFNIGEKENNEQLAKQYANLCDVFVMDAFGTAHRAQASTYGVSKFVANSCAGILLFKELEALNKVFENPARPMVAVVGGSKVSTKLTVLDSLLKISDNIIIGGGIANTFIAAQGYNIGKSLYEIDLITKARHLLKNRKISIPIDVKTSIKPYDKGAEIIKYTNNIKDQEQILDIGDQSILCFSKILKKAKTIFWNGPMGVFELINFRKGTESVAHAIADSLAFSIAGGGDTLSAIDLFGISENISYISTGGGALLEFVEGKKLPAVVALEDKAK